MRCRKHETLRYIVKQFSYLCLLISSFDAFILPKNTANISTENPFFIFELLTNIKNFNLISDPLIEDVDLDGNLDVYFSTIDGTLYGIPDVLKCITVKSCSTRYGNWPITHHNELFFSSPHAVDVFADGVKSVLFISLHGTVFIYDYLGNLLLHLQIPDVILDRSVLSHPNFNKSVLESIYWASASNQLPVDIRLHPVVYTDPIVLTSVISRSNVDDRNFLYTDLLHIGLNFITYPYRSTAQSESSSSDVGNGGNILIAAIVNIPRCALFHLKVEDFKLCLPHLKVLEANWLSSPLAPFIFSSPTISANVLEESRISDHIHLDSYYSFITTLSGNIHVVKLSMLSRTNKLSLDLNATSFIDSYSSHVTPMALPCIPSPCPLDKMKSNNVLQSSVRTCCLQLDIYSCLRLIQLIPTKKYHSQIYWTYCPTTINTTNTSVEYVEQTSQVVIVPGCQKSQTCSPWSVYTTSDGYAHSVDIQTGLLTHGYPVSLSTTSYTVTNLSIGSGLLYQREDYTYWLLFTDVYTNFIHLRLHNPLVIISPNYDNLLNQPNSRRILLSPRPLPLLPGETKMPPCFLLFDHALMLLLSNRFSPTFQSSPASLLTYSKYVANVKKSVTPITPFQFISAQFVNDYFEPVDSIVLDDNRRTVNYLIRDCSYHSNIFNESRLAKRFLVRLLTSFGVPISKWSNAYVTSTQPEISACYNCDCSIGSLSIENNPPVGSYNSELYLSVIDSTNGYFIANYPMSTGSTEISSRIVLHIGRYQTQFIVSLVYLPGLYLFIGLTLVHLFSMPSAMKDVHKVERLF
ncbi:hypothetical protein MN116_008309 [Schistosoma mekongi]|uniref:Uncharacterized protein n=1 Tax=Schistosoma mekongi TaxID=38744 RepID=A0AAE2D1X6_SCHME|nr:hypothetical protein MN116_008309 [Schistosoma mekongi]